MKKTFGKRHETHMQLIWSLMFLFFTRSPLYQDHVIPHRSVFFSVQTLNYKKDAVWIYSVRLLFDAGCSEICSTLSR